MEENIIFVKNVYFDTNILRSLPLTAPSTDFLNLKDQCDKLKIKLLIPELVLKEYINLNKYDVSSGLSDIEDAFRIINNRVNSKISFTLPKDETFHKETESIIKQKISNMGIDVIKKAISYDKFEDIALKEITPFKTRSSKKSIRDCIIMVSVLEHASDFPDNLHIFITNDNAFYTKDMDSITMSYGVKIKILKSFTEATDIIIKTLDNAVKIIYKEREKNLISYLDSQNSEILKFVRRSKFNSFTLGMGEFGMPSLNGTVEKINAIEYDSIHSVRPPMDFPMKEGKRASLSFMVRLKFNVTVRNYSFPLGKEIGLEQDFEQNSEEKSDVFQKALLEGLLSATSPHILGYPINEQTISRNISIEASVFFKIINGVEEYSDLKLVRVVT